MAKKEQEFTTQILVSLRRAGVLDAYKVPDTQWRKDRPFKAHPRPCDVMGTLPGGRALRLEVKQRRASETTNRPRGLSMREFAPHQFDALRTCHELGGVGVVAYVSWSPGVRGACSGDKPVSLPRHWHLYLWTWPEFVQASNDCRRPIEQTQLMDTPHLDRLKPGAQGWKVDAYVDMWTNREAPLVYLSHEFGGVASNLDRAITALAWAQRWSEWGPRVQAPWIASARAMIETFSSEAEWIARGGLAVERETLRGYGALLHVGGYQGNTHAYSPGMRREALAMVEQGGRVYERVGDGIIETTAGWRTHLALEGSMA